ncbi:MAG: TRAP transporter substrate-binding protein [Propionibacteriaceae bacterium]|jgi:tripartite ATP-independent transporter DctP family solute receptor|nr:TRAP transporter substrate-binding protein [Propionibacteriaceae bacterium]
MKQSLKLASALALSVVVLTSAACSRNPDAGTDPTSGDGSGTAAVADCTTPIKTFKLAFNQTEEHPQFQAALWFGEQLLEATDGCYGIEGFANETLGAQAAVLNNVSDGSVDMAYIGGPVMETMNPDTVVFNLPYVFDSKEAQDAVFSDEAVIGDLKHSMEGSKDITVLSLLYSGTRNVYATKAVRSPADMTGMKLRVQQSESQVAMIDNMGGIATPMAQGEVYSALQTGTLDGAENNETVYQSMKHDEVAPFYSYTKHLMIPDYLIMNTTALDGMGDEYKQALLDLVPATTKMANDGFVEYVDESIEISKTAGATFVEDVDTAAFKASVAPLIEQYVTNDVTQALYDAVQEANAAHPAS